MISAIIPALNEAAALPDTLAAAWASLGTGEEILVVDGGSRDGTPEIALKQGARVIQSERGRGRQMNAGAAAATGGLLLFLHADTHLPPSAGDLIRQSARDPAVLGGNFRLRFDAPGLLPWLFALGYNARSRRQRLFYGDSGLWVRGDVFAALGGYREAVLMEDYAFCLALRAEARRRAPSRPLSQTLPWLNAAVVTSARRFHGRRGLALRMLATWSLLHVLYACGVPTETLERRFYPPSSASSAG